MEKNQRIILELTPWFNKEEFETVFRCLYKDNILHKRWAVDRISVWVTRSSNGLAMPIDATAALVRAVIQDTMLNQIAVCQAAEIRTLYSMALVRFVNLITESEIPRSSNRSVPLRLAARQLGIPEYIVNLRHNATHASTPTLSMLRNGAEFALTWLKSNYWEKELALFTDWIILPDSSENDITELLRMFMTTQLNLMHALVNKKKNRQKMASIINKIKKFIRKNRDTFIDVLIQPGLFIPTSEDLEYLLAENDKYFVEEDDSFVLPNSLQMFWSPVINALLNGDAIQEFTEELMLKCHILNDLFYQRLAITWVKKLLMTSLQDENSNGDAIFNHLKLDFNWRRLLRYALKEPCKFTSEILPIIADEVKPPLSPEKKNYLMALVAVKVGVLVSHTPEANAIGSDLTGSLTVADVKAAKKARARSANHQKTESENVPQEETKNMWMECPDDIDFSTLPLGAIIGGYSGVDCLVLGDKCRLPTEETVYEDDQMTMNGLENTDEPDVCSNEEENKVADGTMEDARIDDNNTTNQFDPTEIIIFSSSYLHK